MALLVNQNSASVQPQCCPEAFTPSLSLLFTSQFIVFVHIYFLSCGQNCNYSWSNSFLFSFPCFCLENKLLSVAFLPSFLSSSFDPSHLIVIHLCHRCLPCGQLFLCFLILPLHSLEFVIPSVSACFSLVSHVFCVFPTWAKSKESFMDSIIENRIETGFGGCAYLIKKKKRTEPNTSHLLAKFCKE